MAHDDDTKHAGKDEPGADKARGSESAAEAKTEAVRTDDVDDSWDSDGGATGHGSSSKEPVGPPHQAESDDEGQEDEDKDEDEDEHEPARAGGSEAAPAALQLAAAGHAHADAHAAEHAEHEEHIGHTTPWQLLVFVLVTLIVLTIVTVYTAGVDLGAQWNLVVALVIATIKASLVVTYFMHLRWDRKLHLLVFLSSVLFLILFLSMSLTDRREYQHAIDLVDTAKAQSK